MHTGSVMLVVALLFVMGLTLYGPDSMISSTAAIDFGTAKAGATAAGFVKRLRLRWARSSAACCRATSTR